MWKFHRTSLPDVKISQNFITRCVNFTQTYDKISGLIVSYFYLYVHLWKQSSSHFEQAHVFPHNKICYPPCVATGAQCSALSMLCCISVLTGLFSKDWTLGNVVVLGENCRVHESIMSAQNFRWSTWHIRTCAAQHCRGWASTSDIILMHILLFCTLVNKRTIISPQIITLLRVSTLSCRPQTACNQYLAKLRKYFKCGRIWNTCRQVVLWCTVCSVLICSFYCTSNLTVHTVSLNYKKWFLCWRHISEREHAT